jgi:hypothetical protein
LRLSRLKSAPLSNAGIASWKETKDGPTAQAMHR